MPIREFRKEDIQPLTKILRATDVFKEDEIDTALELMQYAIEEPHQKDYRVFTYVDDAKNVRGFCCVGPTPMTTGTFDLYWIVVDPRMQRTGIGRQMVEHCEAFVRSNRGRLIVIETSSHPKYESTRSFYEHNHYKEVARVRDYYALGEDLIIYIENL